MTPATNAESRAASATSASPPSGAVWLETHDLTVHFGNRSALRGINARFGPAETISVLGPNGAGKSTLLRALAGMLAPSHGAVTIAGRPLKRPDRRVVYVPQRSGVDWTFPVSVLDVVLMGRLRRRSRWLPIGRADRAAAIEALARVGMDHLAGVQIGQLSGGQQQRVFLARALLQDGEILLLDEPFNGVDLPTQDLLGELFAGLRARGGTVVYATHDLERAARTSDRVMLINGRLVADGAPPIAMTAANLRAAFGGQAILLHEEPARPVASSGSPASIAAELVESGR